MSRERLLREAIIGFTGAETGDDRGTARRAPAQGIGEYCNGTDLEECRAVWSEALGRVCARCPD